MNLKAVFSYPLVNFLWIVCQLNTLLEVLTEAKIIFSANVKENIEADFKILNGNYMQSNLGSLSQKEKPLKHKLLV